MVPEGSPERLERRLGTLLGALGALLGALGRLLGALGVLLGVLGSALLTFSVQNRCQRANFGDLGWIWN